MLIVSGLVEIKPENAQAAITAALEMAIASNEEAGCHSYAFYADLEVEGRFRVFEEWEDLAALEEHFELSSMEIRRSFAVPCRMRGSPDSKVMSCSRIPRADIRLCRASFFGDDTMPHYRSRQSVLKSKSVPNRQLFRNIYGVGPGENCSDSVEPDNAVVELSPPVIDIST